MLLEKRKRAKKGGREWLSERVSGQPRRGLGMSARELSDPWSKEGWREMWVTGKVVLGVTLKAR